MTKSQCTQESSVAWQLGVLDAPANDARGAEAMQTVRQCHCLTMVQKKARIAYSGGQSLKKIQRHQTFEAAGRESIGLRLESKLWMDQLAELHYPQHPTKSLEMTLTRTTALRPVDS